MQLVKQFGRAVKWCWEWPDNTDRILSRFFGRVLPDPVAVTEADRQRMRERVIHDVASRAVEWNWEQPDKIYDFIRAEEPPGGGYMRGVTAEEIFQYAQQHYAELLPKRSDPESQKRLDDLRANLRRDQLSPQLP